MSRARTGFLSHLVHEMRGSLGVILGFSRLLEASDDSSPETRESGELIARAGETLLGLVDDLTVLTAAAGELSVVVEPVPLAGVIGGAVEMVGGDAAAREIEIHVDAGDLAVLADARRLRQVLVDLLANAVRYNRAGGRYRFARRAATGRSRSP